MKWILIVLFLFGFQTYAEEAMLNPLNLKVGPELSYYRYVEPGLISHTGFLVGAWLNWGYQTPYYRGILQTDLLTGQINYDGALCDIKTDQCNDYKAKTNDLLFKIAHRFDFNLNEKFSVFIGLSYRYLFDKGDGAGFYRRLGQYYTIPVGLTFKHSLDKKNATLIFDFQYDYFYSGAIESKLSDVNYNYSDVKHTQDNGYALKMILGYEPQKTSENPQPWMYYLTYEKWVIDQSNRAELLINGGHSGNYFFEPENYSEALALRVGWAY